LKGSDTVPAALAAGARRAWFRPFLRRLLRLKPPVQQQPRRRLNGSGLLPCGQVTNPPLTEQFVF
jgi:hypothetical protein